MAAAHTAKQNKKVVYIDTENSFSIERLSQIAGLNYINILDKILLLKVSNFEDQCQKIEMIKNLVNIDLIIIDTIGMYYRDVLKENPKETNKKMGDQLEILKKLSQVSYVLRSRKK